MHQERSRKFYLSWCIQMFSTHGSRETRNSKLLTKLFLKMGDAEEIKEGPSSQEIEEEIKSSQERHENSRTVIVREACW